MDVAGLSKLSEQAILNLVMVLGFLAHGYATGRGALPVLKSPLTQFLGEFETTTSRLGVYLPVEHIDNPYGCQYSFLLSSAWRLTYAYT